MKFPAASVYVQMIVCVPWVVYVVGLVVVPTRAPEQLSFAVGAVAVALHSPVTSGSVASVGVGCCPSEMITSNEQDTKAPDESTAV